MQLTNEEAANLARIVEEERKITEEQAKRRMHSLTLDERGDGRQVKEAN